MDKNTAAASVAGLAALALLAGTAPAVADATTVVDGDDSPIKADLTEVRIAHTSEHVRVRLLFDDLLRDGRRHSQGVSIFFDTDPTDRGPEYRLSSGLNSGTDYQLDQVRGWGDVQGESLQNCDYIGRFDWRRDTATFRVDPPCFDDLEEAPEVAVAVKVGEWTRPTGTRTDWLLGTRTFTEPVARD